MQGKPLESYWECRGKRDGEGKRKPPIQDDDDLRAQICSPHWTGKADVMILVSWRCRGLDWTPPAWWRCTPQLLSHIPDSGWLYKDVLHVLLEFKSGVASILKRLDCDPWLGWCRNESQNLELSHLLTTFDSLISKPNVFWLGDV